MANKKSKSTDREDREYKNAKYSKSSTRSTKRSKRGERFDKADKDSRGTPANSDFVCSAGRPTNDPKWYLNNPILSRDIGSIWFSRPTGDKLNHSGIVVRSNFTNPTPTTDYDVYDPGILSIPVITTWGSIPALSGAGASGQGIINLTAQKLYQYVVHANSRNISYDKKDLIMTMMAIDGVYQVITEAIRAYRLIAHYDPENKYADMLLKAAHWDPADLRANVAEFRYYINWAITRINKLFMPNLFDVVKAHVAAFENIYTDRPSNKAQFIVKYSAGVWVYDDVHGALEYKREVADGNILYTWTSGTLPYCRNVNVFTHVVDVMITNIENAQYLGVMQGDLLKAFGMEMMTKYNYIGIDMPFAPVYDEEFLLKLHNADISNTGVVTAFAYANANGEHCAIIMRDDNTVNGNMACYRAEAFGNNIDTDIRSNILWNQVRVANGTMVDLPVHIPSSPENVMLMTLNKLGTELAVTDKWYVTDTSTITLWVGSLPPEVFLAAKLYIDPEDISTSVDVTTYYGTTSTFARATSYMSRFKMHPMFTTFKTTDADILPISWETDNVTNISNNMYERIMSVVFWSLWASSTISSSDVH